MYIHQLSFYLNKNMTNNIKIISLNCDPFDLFSEWFSLAEQNEINDPNAMDLATVGNNLRPSSRIVLLKSHGNSGFVFYTNLKSRKGIDLVDKMREDIVENLVEVMAGMDAGAAEAIMEASDTFKG